MKFRNLTINYFEYPCFLLVVEKRESSEMLRNDFGLVSESNNSIYQIY